MTVVLEGQWVKILVVGGRGTLPRHPGPAEGASGRLGQPRNTMRLTDCDMSYEQAIDIWRGRFARPENVHDGAIGSGRVASVADLECGFSPSRGRGTPVSKSLSFSWLSIGSVGRAD